MPLDHSLFFDSRKGPRRRTASLSLDVNDPGYPAQPPARYFSVDRLTRGQIEDYARRKGMKVSEVERWLASNLGYDP